MNPEVMAERVLICGDVMWDNLQLILDELSTIQQDRGIEEVIVGEATIGAELLGRQAAVRLGIPVALYATNWRKYGQQAHSVRNTQMLTEGRPTMGLAFHGFLNNSKRTKALVDLVRGAGIPVHVITGKEQ